MSTYENFAVIINKLKVTGDNINSIHDIIQWYRIMRYWSEQGRFPADQSKNIVRDVI